MHPRCRWERMAPDAQCRELTSSQQPPAPETIQARDARSASGGDSSPRSDGNRYAFVIAVATWPHRTKPHDVLDTMSKRVQGRAKARGRDQPNIPELLKDESAIYSSARWRATPLRKARCSAPQTDTAISDTTAGRLTTQGSCADSAALRPLPTTTLRDGDPRGWLSPPAAPPRQHEREARAHHPPTQARMGIDSLLEGCIVRICRSRRRMCIGAPRQIRCKCFSSFRVLIRLARCVPRGVRPACERRLNGVEASPFALRLH